MVQVFNETGISNPKRKMNRKGANLSKDKNVPTIKEALPIWTSEITTKNKESVTAVEVEAKEDTNSFKAV